MVRPGRPAHRGYRMDKLVALLSYAYQALLAFGSLLVIAHLLTAADYTVYSLFMATTQLAAIAAFEWIRFSCSRFYPGPDDLSEALQRGTMRREFAAAAAACTLVAAISALVGLVSTALAALGLVVVLLQGWTDLHLTMLRFRHQFTAFSFLQGFRATALSIGSVLGALLLHTVEGAACGLAAGYVLISVVAWTTDRTWRADGRWDMTTIRQHLHYGTISAGASVIGLVAPLGLRVVLQAAFGSAAAGALLAIDLLQRPFVLVISAVHGVQYPVVVRAHDHQDGDFGSQLGRYYALLVTLALVTAAGVAAILPLIAGWLVTDDMRAAFMASAPAVLVVFLARATTQNVFATPAHLLKRMRVIAVLALGDAVLLNTAATIGSALPGATLASVCLAAAIGSAVYTISGLATLSALPFSLVLKPVLPALAAVIACLAISAATWTPLGALVSMATGGALSAISLWWLYAEYRRRRREGFDVAG